MRGWLGGQSSLEVALAVSAITVLFFGSLKMWGWADTNLVHRQQQFQATRLAAGQPATAGTDNPYTWEPLNIYGNLTTPANQTSVPLPTCPAGEELMAQAQTLLDQAVEKFSAAEAASKKTKPYDDETARLSGLYDDPNGDGNASDGCIWAYTNDNFDNVGLECGMLSGASMASLLGRNFQHGCGGGFFSHEDMCKLGGENIQTIGEKRQPFIDQASALNAEGQSLNDQAQALIRQANDVCGGFQTVPTTP